MSEKNENSMIFKNNVVKLVNINTNEAKNLYLTNNIIISL